MPNRLDADRFDRTRHLISDRALNRLVARMEDAEAAQRAPDAPPADPLAREVALLRESAIAYAAWRGPLVPRGWRRVATPTGGAWQRRGVRVAARLTPRLGAGLCTLTVEVSRPGGAHATSADALVATRAFVPADSVVRIDAIDRGGPVLTARWAVRVPVAGRQMARAVVAAAPANDAPGLAVERVA